MEIIKLPEPWAFYADEDITRGELEELQSYFVDDTNIGCSWEICEYNGISSEGGSDWHTDIKYFDEVNQNEEDVDEYSINELREIIAKHKEHQLEEGVVYYVEDLNDPDWSWLAMHNVAYVNIHQKRLSTAGESWLSEFNTKDRYKFTKATPAQIKHYEACVKAGKYVEPEEEFIVGKWYKWFQKDHDVTHIGKCVGVYGAHFEMNPWIWKCEKHSESGVFYSDKAENIELLEDLTEIQHLLPEGHVDKVVSKETITTEATCETCGGEGRVMEMKLYPSGPCEVTDTCPDCNGDGYIEEETEVKEPTRSERYVKTMQFFEQLREPERSEAIVNYNEGRSGHEPDNLFDALNFAFNWENSNEGNDYWNEIARLIERNTYFKEPELLVFGKYKVGDIVVTTFGKPYSCKIYKIAEGSTKDCLKTVEGGLSELPESWRLATPEEVEAYNQGVRNISDIKPKPMKRAVKFNSEEERRHILAHFNPAHISLHGIEKGFMCLERGSWSTEWKGFSKDNYTELSFEDWCKEFNHPFKVEKEAVHCTTQEEWDYVLRKFNPCNLDSDYFLEEGNQSTITVANQRNLSLGSYANVDYDKSEGFTILTFQQWCDKYGHEGLKPYVAKVGDWVYITINRPYGSTLKIGDIVQCTEVDEKEGSSFSGQWTCRIAYRKATQAEIDSVTKTTEEVLPPEPQWTVDNWYVEVTSQEEANEVIKAAAKMYGKEFDTHFTIDCSWKYVSFYKNERYQLMPLWIAEDLKAKPRPISDFIPVKQESSWQSRYDLITEAVSQGKLPLSAIYSGKITDEDFTRLKNPYQQQQDELVIYKPKRLIL